MVGPAVLLYMYSREKEAEKRNIEDETDKFIERETATDRDSGTDGDRETDGDSDKDSASTDRDSDRRR